MVRRRVTLVDVARLAGVSPATASFVLSGRGGRPAGSPQAQELVRAAAQELGYTPNRHARAMRTGRSGAIALALGDPRDPWVTALAHRVSELAQPLGLSTVVLVDESWYEFLQGHQFDCSFVTGVDLTAKGQQRVTELGRQGHRLVVMSELSTPEDFDVVASLTADSVATAYATLRQRHDHVHFMATTSRPVTRPLRTRRELFLEAATAHGDPAEELVVHVPAVMAEARQAAFDWLGGSDRPTAIIAQTGYLAIAAQLAAQQRAIAIPDDLEIISIGDVPAADSLLAPVSYYGASSVFDRIAEVVVRRARAEDDEPFTRTELPWVFHPGATTRGPT